MKKLIYIILLLPLWGCGDFLDEVDQDKLVPEKTDHYAALLLNEFNYDYPLFRSVDVMTDNVVENVTALASQKNGFKTTYSWQREIEIDEEGNRLNNINNAWQGMYEDIAIANYVIELIDEAIGTKEDIAFVKGEAYFIRALSYFNLLNLYGQPFNPATANVDLGVPLRNNIGVEETYDRNTVAEGYTLIENDLAKAIQLIDSSGVKKSIWHPTVVACNLLMSRVKLYQHKWDEVILYANKVTEVAKLSVMYTDMPFITENNREVLYSYYAVNPIFKVGNSTSNAYKASGQLYNLYDTNDKRRSVFFSAADDGSGNFKYQTLKYQKDTYTTLGFVNLRVAEAYLNRAEAYAHKSDVTNATNDIKALCTSRYASTTSISYPTDATALLTFILNERRKELCFEDHHRWFDLRRMENRPQIKHVFTVNNDDGTKLGTETYTLLPNDYNYTLPIPLKERENNPLIRNNERFEKIPEIDDVLIID